MHVIKLNQITTARTNKCGSSCIYLVSSSGKHRLPNCWVQCLIHSYSLKMAHTHPNQYPFSKAAEQFQPAVMYDKHKVPSRQGSAQEHGELPQSTIVHSFACTFHLVAGDTVCQPARFHCHVQIPQKIPRIQRLYCDYRNLR